MTDLAAEIAELKKRLAELEAKQSALEPKAEFVPDPKLNETLRQYNPLDGVGMPGSALKTVADLINPKDVKYDPGAWARNRPSVPGGFGAPPDAKRNEPPIQREDELKIPDPPKSYWSK